MIKIKERILSGIKFYTVFRDGNYIGLIFTSPCKSLSFARGVCVSLDEIKEIVHFMEAV